MVWHMSLISQFVIGANLIKLLTLQGVKKVPDPKQNYIGLMTEG